MSESVTFNNTNYSFGYFVYVTQYGNTFKSDSAYSLGSFTLTGMVASAGDNLTAQTTVRQVPLYATGYDSENYIVFETREPSDSIGGFGRDYNYKVLFSNIPVTRAQTYTFTEEVLGDFQPVCFAAGTRIRAALGEQAVEGLSVGDFVVTGAGALRPIRWIGHRTVDCRRHPRPSLVLPVRISAGAFGPGKPARDLTVSPAHALCIEAEGGEVLIPAVRLINGTTVARIEVESVTYWHVELDSHDILLAEGLPAESYIECDNRRFFANVSVTSLWAAPDERPDTTIPFCRPFHEEGPVIEAVRARLEARSRVLGWNLDASPLAGLHLVADGAVIPPEVDGLTARFALPAEARDVRLVSEVSVAAHVVAGSSDDRRLGVAVSGLAFAGDEEPEARAVAIDDPRLGVGFHPVDRDGSTCWRWTDGAAVLPSTLWARRRGTVRLEVALAKPALPRWIAPPRPTTSPPEKTARL